MRTARAEGPAAIDGRQTRPEGAASTAGHLLDAFAKGPGAVGYGAGRIPPNGADFDKLEA